MGFDEDFPNLQVLKMDSGEFTEFPSALKRGISNEFSDFSDSLKKDICEEFSEFFGVIKKRRFIRIMLTCNYQDYLIILHLTVHEEV
jgi:hypothetical protein